MMAKSFVKGTLTLKALNADKKAENVTLGNLVEDASPDDIKAVRDAIGTLVEHPITTTQVAEVYHID